MSSAIDLKLDGDGAWPDLGAKRQAGELVHLGEGSTIGVIVLEGGMSSGRASVAFRIDLPDGRVVVAETSWRLLAMACRAIAARHGWPE